MARREASTRPKDEALVGPVRSQPARSRGAPVERPVAGSGSRSRRPARERTLPRFSVLIPVWRGERWIGRAMASVRAQTLEDWELVVGDNASDDDTVEIARRAHDPRVRVESWSDHVSIFENFNRSFARSRGTWVYLLPADDVLAPQALERIAATIDAHVGRRDLVAVLPRARRVDEDGRPIDTRYHGVQAEADIAGGTYDAEGWLRAVARPGSPPWDGGAFLRSAIEATGTFYRTDIPTMSADFELDIRIAAHGDVAFIDEPLLAVTGYASSDTPQRVRRNLASGDPSTPRGQALAVGLQAHEAVRAVRAEERRLVAAAIARTHLRRATAHRISLGGAGRRGALNDLYAAWKRSRPTALRALPRAALLLVAPAWFVKGVRLGVLWIRELMRRILQGG